MRIFNFLVTFLLVFLAGCVASTHTPFGERRDTQAFIQKISAQHHFDPEKLTYLFNQVKPRPVFIHQENKPHEHTLSWVQYRSIFLTPARIKAGAQFWQIHAQALQLAQQKYKVDPSIIVGIIGVETAYGQHLGNYRVMDSLCTLAFNYPKRQRYFQSELEQYLLLTRELQKNPLDLYGSYAGAVGLPQFMPSNYRRLAVSYVDKSATSRAPDLWQNPDDAILSVANYFHHHHWQLGKPVAVQQNSQPDQPYLAKKQFGQDSWFVFANFNVIKRYNNSDFYAMSVYQLSQAIKNVQKN